MKRFETIAAVAFTLGLVAVGAWVAMEFLGSSSKDPVTPTDETAVQQADPTDEPEVPDAVRVDRTETRVTQPEPREPTQATRDPQGEHNTAILGRVVAPDGSPVSGADIELARGPALVMTMPSLRNPTGVATQSEADGTFEFRNLTPADDYLVVAMHPDFSDGVAGPIDLNEGETETLGDIRLQKGVKVFGFVGSNGRPLASALVSLHNNSAGFGLDEDEEPVDQVLLTVTTDTAGQFQFDAVPIQQFEVTVEAEGYGKQTRSNHSLFNTPEDQQIDFDLTVADKISGLVVDSNGRPVEAVIVTGNLAGEQFRCDAEGTTGNDGRFELDNLATGFYHLTARAEGFSTNTKPRVQSGSTNLEITLLEQGRITGQVMDEESGTAVTEFTLHVMRSIPGRDPARTALKKSFRDASGNFEFKGLDPNSYILEARAKGYAPSYSEEIRVQRNEVVTGAVVLLNRGGTVSGRVVSGNGKPVSKATVRINPNDFNWNPVHDLMEKMAKTDNLRRQVRTAKDGSFTIDLIVPGVYQIAARHPRYADMAMNDIEVRKNETANIGDLSLPMGGTVEGLALDIDGRPLVGATINAISKASDYKQARCDNEGRFIVAGLRAGEYTVSIASYVSDPPENILVQMLKAKGSAQQITLRDGDAVSVTLQLSEAAQN